MGQKLGESLEEKTVRLSLPAEASFARSVRMMAANLAVVCGMSVDDVEDIRMAAEEGFVFSCATSPSACDIAFTLSDEGISMDFSLGEADCEEGDEETESLDLAELLLSAVCDSYEVSPDGRTLHVVKRLEAAHAD